jgi:hypothetical protein
MKKKKNKVVLGIVIVALIAVVLGLIYFSYNPPKIPMGQTPAPVSSITLDDAVKGIKAQQIKEETEKLSIEVNYPKTGLDYADTEIQSFAESIIQSFKDVVGGNNSAINDKYTLNVDYVVQKYNGRILSFKFLIAEYTGGVHPNYTDATYVFDFVNKKKLSLSDLFAPNSNYLKIVSDISIAEFKANDISDDTWINDGAGPNPINYKNFTVSEDSIIFYFSPYQVASYSAGEQTIMIPLTRIKTILNPALFPVAEQGTVNQSGIALDSLKSGDKISSPATITGSVNGNGWIGFEGQVGRVELLDSKGDPLAISSLSATTEWTQLPVKFSATLTFIVPQGVTAGKLVFYNENPSGIADKDQQFTLPIVFK